jgi:hypothetical protein
MSRLFVFLVNWFRAHFGRRHCWQHTQSEQYPPDAHPEDFPVMPEVALEAVREFVAITEGLTDEQWATYEHVDLTECEENVDDWGEADDAAGRVFRTAYESGRLHQTYAEWEELDHVADSLCTKPAGGGSYIAVALGCQDLIDPTDLYLIVRTWLRAGLPLPPAAVEQIETAR